MKKIALVSLILFLTLISCEKDYILKPSQEKEKLEKSYLSYKKEFSLAINDVKTKGNLAINDEIIYSESKEDLLIKINTQFGENLNKYYSKIINSMFEGKTSEITLDVIINDDQLSFDERQAVTLALACTDAFFSLNPLDTRASASDCDKAYESDKLIALGDAVVAGGLGFFGVQFQQSLVIALLEHGV